MLLITLEICLFKTFFWRGSITSRVNSKEDIMNGFVKRIETLADERLVKIDPQEKGFFDEVLNFNFNGVVNFNFIHVDSYTHLGFWSKVDKQKFRDFRSRVRRAKRARIKAFYKPIYDPSFQDDVMVFEKGRFSPNYNYNKWRESVSKMKPVEGRRWSLGNENQYYAFLVWLVNQLVKKGKSIEEAMYRVVIDSDELGVYYRRSRMRVTLTGEKEVCGIFDLASTRKVVEPGSVMLKMFNFVKEKKTGRRFGYIVVGGDDFDRGYKSPLAKKYFYEDKKIFGSFGAVGWMVL